MTTPDPTTPTTATYNAMAPAYADRWGDFILTERMDVFAGYLKRGGPVLDLGCGPGRDMRAFAARGITAIGIDRSAGMLREAAQRSSGPLVQADMRRLPFARHSFKGVWALASMLHLPKTDFPAALKEIYHVLDHGHIFIAVKQGNEEAWHDDGPDGRRFFAYYHPAEVELALERANFHVLWVKTNSDSRPNSPDWINVIGWTKIDTVTTGANAIIFNEAGQVLLTRRTDNGLWCIPGGHLDPGEAIETAAVREALEETGLQVEIVAPTGMYSIAYPAHLFPEGKRRAIFIVAFRCRTLGGQLTLNDEVSEFCWCDPHRLPPDLIMYHEERILDALKYRQG